MNPTLKELLIFGRSMRKFIQHSFVLAVIVKDTARQNDKQTKN